MTHAINSNTNLLSTDITRTHTQMRKNPRGAKESGEEMTRVEQKKLEKKKKKRRKEKKIFKKKERKKSINK